MRDTRLRQEEKPTNYGMIFAMALTVVVAVYSYLMSNPQVLARVPGIAHYETHHYQKSNEQRRRDAHMKESEEHAHISDVDRDALRMLLEASR